MDVQKYLKLAFPVISKRAILIALISALLVMVFFEHVSRIAIVLVMIVLAGFSKIYHRVVKTTIGIDLVLFFTIMIALIYSPVLALFTGWVSLILADAVGTRFSHTSIVSLAGLSVVSLLAKILLSMNIVAASIILVIVFEIISSVLYYLLGSSFPRIFAFLATHLGFNLFLILSFAQKIKELML